MQTFVMDPAQSFRNYDYSLENVSPESFCVSVRLTHKPHHSSTKQINPHLLPLALHDPDRRLAGRRTGVRFLSGRLQIWGEVLLPHGGGQRGVRVPLTVSMCLLLHPLHLFGYFIPRHRFLERRGGAGGWSGPRRAPRVRLRSLWSSSRSGAHVVSLQVSTVHDLFCYTEIRLKVIFLRLFWIIGQIQPRLK